MAVSIQQWTPEDLVAPLAVGEIRCWKIDLDELDSSDRLDWSILDEEERGRAARYRIAAIGRRFAVGRAALRTILGALTERSPAALRFVYGPLGKPALACSDDGRIAFNLTHSESTALIAVAGCGEIGVDVEVIRDRDDPAGLVRRYFGSRECEEFLALPESQRRRAFFVGWTRKEAVVKATGKGIAANLEAIDVGFSPRPSGFDVCLADDPAGAPIRVWDLEAGPGLAAALALRAS